MAWQGGDVCCYPAVVVVFKLQQIITKQHTYNFKPFISTISRIQALFKA